MPCRIRVRVASVRSVRDPEGREGVAVEFVEVRERPPAAVFMSPTGVPREVGEVVSQITRSIQSVMPIPKQYELKKLVVIFTAEELEAFGLKPYPNQVYEVEISKGNLKFRSV